MRCDLCRPLKSAWNGHTGHSHGQGQLGPSLSTAVLSARGGRLHPVYPPRVGPLRSSEGVMLERAHAALTRVLFLQPSSARQTLPAGLGSTLLASTAMRFLPALESRCPSGRLTQTGQHWAPVCSLPFAGRACCPGLGARPAPLSLPYVMVPRKVAIFISL